GNVEIHSVDNLGGDGRNRMWSAASNFTAQISGLKQWQRNLHFVQHSIKGLQHSVVDGSSHKVRRGLAYKLFTILVAYSPTYQGMEEVIFDSEGLEATAVVRLQLVVGRYELNPFCRTVSVTSLDLSCIQANTRDYRPYTTDVAYQTYVKMQPIRKDNSAYARDVYMTQNNQILASYRWVTFNKVEQGS
ncbi:hypothetical protein MauCBS54593_006169, partial [Microsporum audouinii]